MLELRRLSVNDGPDVFRMLQEIPYEENGFGNKVHGMTYEEYKSWLLSKHQESLWEGITDGWKVPTTTYWLFADGVPVGVGKLRHFLTDALRNAGGHIGYAIAPKYRGNGYGNVILRLLLEKASEMGIEKVLITVRLDNIVSRAVALANGGVVSGRTDKRLLIWAATNMDRLSGKTGMIRKMNREEIPACVDLIRKSFMTVADEFGFTAENASRFTAFSISEERLLWQLDQEHRPMFVFEDAGVICGYYSLTIMEDHRCELNNLAVLPEYRHRGIGRRLLEHSFTTAHSMNCTLMIIGIVEENSRLRRWYETFGAVHVGTRKFDFFPFTCGYMKIEV